MVMTRSATARNGGPTALAPPVNMLPNRIIPIRAEYRSNCAPGCSSSNATAKVLAVHCPCRPSSRPTGPSGTPGLGTVRRLPAVAVRTLY